MEPKVLLVSMPYGALERPALGLSLLKAGLREAGIACDIRYLTFAFAECIGLDEYLWISSDLPYTAFAGDWSFTSALYGDRPDADRRYVEEVLRRTWQLDDWSVRQILHIRSLVPHFLDHCLAAVPWGEYAVVGFTSTFEQNIASLALAKRIKARCPGTTIVFGGANWEGAMGQELLRQFPFVDYACSGEADRGFPALARQILVGRAPYDDGGTPIPGVVYRAGGRPVRTEEGALVRDVDTLPVPEYDDYFHALTESTIGASVVPTLLLETSRGCWWGAKSHCTFCGLNGGAMTFRSKTARRALDELRQLVDRWKIDYVEVVDNILDMTYFNDLLPTLADERGTVRLFYEVKANLTRQQVQLLRDAGVYRIQPGLESLSDHVLRLMRKGTTALRNVQLLKWCKEYGVAVDWNILYGFPGETREDYADMLRLLPAIRFLQPPHACGPIRLDRFSPFHESPEAFGFTNVRPIAPYKYLYPFDGDSQRAIAYYFEFDYAPGRDPSGYAADVIAYVEDWKRRPESGVLRQVLQPDGTLVLFDTRSDASIRQLALIGLERAAYEYCDAFRRGSAVTRHLRERFPTTEFADERVLDFLESLVANRLMITDGVNYLSLAISDPPVRVPYQRRTPLPVALANVHLANEALPAPRATVPQA